MKKKQYRCGVVAVHGICGNPRLFSMFLNEETERDMLVDRIVLDGHGGSALDFSKKGSMHRWKSQVLEAVDRMHDKCDKVVIAGHSMGCLLALSEAFKGRADGLFLLCPPLKLHITTPMFVNSAKVTFGWSKNNPVIIAARDAYGLEIDHNPLHFYGWIPRFLELFGEIRRIDRMLLSNALEIPVKVFLSEKDESVSPRSDRYLLHQKQCEVTYLNKSTHYYFDESDKGVLRSVFAEFMSEICK